MTDVMIVVLSEETVYVVEAALAPAAAVCVAFVVKGVSLADFVARVEYATEQDLGSGCLSVN